MEMDINMDDSPDELHIDEGQDSNTPINSTPFSYTARGKAYYSSTSIDAGNALVQRDTTAISSPNFDSIYSQPYSSVSASSMWSGGDHIPPQFRQKISSNFYDGVTDSYQSRPGYHLNQQQFAEGFHQSHSGRKTAEENYSPSSRKLNKMAAPSKKSSKKKTKNSLNQSLHYPFQTNSFSSGLMANPKR